MIRTIFLLIFLLSADTILKAQQKDRVLFNGTFEGVKAVDFFKRLEATSSYYFYYDVIQLDSVYINLKVKDQPVEEVLKRAFQNTDIQYAMDDQGHIFITRKVQIVTSLPEQFFQADTIGLNNNTVTLSIRSYNQKAKRILSENKIYEVGVKTNNLKPVEVVLTGHIKNERSGEPVINASVFVDKLNIGTLTDQYGYYSLTLPPGKYTLEVQSISMKDTKYQVMIYSDGVLELELKEQVNALKEVVVSTQKVANVNRVQLGVERLNMEAIKRVPTVFGEADVMRVVLTLPGVKTVGEASTGFNVRGGSSDQNLVLMNGATIYNPSHFFGMFSAFNPEIVKDIELYKSSIPAKYGGRLSSVLEIGLKEGNKKEVTGSAGIGLVTSRFNIEGPIIKDRTSFIVGGRSTYANWLLNLLPSPYNRSKASFNDGNVSVSHHFDIRNDIYATGYMSSDRFSLANDTTYGYNNRNIALKWKHSFGSKLLAYFSGGFDKYNYNVKSEKNRVNAYLLDFDINQANIKSDFVFQLHSNHSLEYGISSLFYKLHPGSFRPIGTESLVKTDIVAPEQALESALYLSDRYTISTKATLSAGIRYSVFNYLGANAINQYAEGLPRDESNVVSTASYGKGRIINTYHGPEYRLSFRYAFTDNFSVKAGYNSLIQYIHMLSNTTAVAPTDIWKLSDPNIKPQRGGQASIGLYKNLKSNTIETSIEFYVKKIKDYMDYKPGATLILNHHVETDVISTKGKAYGAEVMLKKSTGKLNGWISYTYSRTLLQMDDSTMGSPVNNGAWYPANYDKPHDVTAVGNFKVNHRFSLSLNITYSTGRPITLPVGSFYYGGSRRVLYSDRNSYRIPDYFRSDFSMNIDGNYKLKQKTHNSWTIGVYNLTGRKNPFSVYYVSEGGYVKGYKLSIFGSTIPFVNFNIKF
jgi:hypothetical protein